MTSGGSPRDLHPVVLLVGDSNLKELKNMTFHEMLGMDVGLSSYSCLDDF